MVSPPASEQVQPSRRCPYGECDGEGLIVDEETNTSRPCSCRGRLIGRATTRRTRSVVPRIYQNVSFDRPPLSGVAPGVRQHVERYLRSLDDNLRAGRGLWFFGDDDEASAALAMLVARKTLDQGWSVAIYSAARVLAELRATFEAESADSYLGLFERLCAVDLLVLTDLGTQRQTEWVMEQLHSLANERWQDGRAMVVTSGLPDDDRRNLEEDLAREVCKLGELRASGAGTDELGRLVTRLEKVIAELRQLDSRPWSEPMDHLRRQLGGRTIDRLEAICEGPVTLMKSSLRLSATG